MANEAKPHIQIGDRFRETRSYQYPKDGGGGSGFNIVQRNRALHGKALLDQLELVKQRFQLGNELEIPNGLLRDDIVYVEFTSEWGYELKFESLDKDTNNNPQFQLLSVQYETRIQEVRKEFRFHATLLLREGGVSHFISRVKEYLSKNIIVTDKETREKIDTGIPRNTPLLNNIQVIEIATLRAFWTDGPEIPFPETNDSIWWEVWFRKTDDDDVRMANVFQNLETVGCQIGASELELTEHRVRLVKGTKDQLVQSLLLLDNLAEIRRPQEISDFIHHKDVTYEDKQEYLHDLESRIDFRANETKVVVCVIDSGVNNGHPLLAPFLPDAHRYTYKEAWGLGDSEPNGGHGTGVASMALYGDLIDALASPHRIQIFHGLESYKIFNRNDLNEPELYAAITISAVNTPVIDRPQSLRIYCMTITDKDFAFSGRPSSWSAAVDKITFGSPLEPPQLFIVSGGNVTPQLHSEYPALNQTESIHAPGQAYNAITVGAYTRKDRIPSTTGLHALAQPGGLAPCSSTSLTWAAQWPNKPDVVMEGGNLSTDGTHLSDHYSLKLLAADSEYPDYLFLPFGDTSSAAGLLAKMAAELAVQYPNFWPETIRGLIAHSASWTTQMLNGRDIQTFRESEKRSLLRMFGYGVPDLERARDSASNSLTIIAENKIQPYRSAGSSGVYNEYHLFELPWPTDVLRNLSEVDATLEVTLSYFIEPNPGSKRYNNHFHYHSHALDFAVIKPNERLDVFRRRISGGEVLPEDERDGSGEPWILGRVGSRGSLRKDSITLSAAEMSERKYIAVFPKNGWYRMRKKEKKFDEIVRYSLIVSIKTEGADIYTPVLNLVANLNPLPA